MIIYNKKFRPVIPLEKMSGDGIFFFILHRIEVRKSRF